MIVVETKSLGRSKWVTGMPTEFLSWRQIGGSAYLEAESVLQELKEYYTLQGESSLQEMLEHNPHVKEALLTAPGEIRQFFPESELHLRVKTDPEEWGAARIVIYIATDRDPTRASELYLALDEKWGDKLLQLGGGLVILNLEFSA